MQANSKKKKSKHSSEKNIKQFAYIDPIIDYYNTNERVSGVNLASNLIRSAKNAVNNDRDFFDWQNEVYNIRNIAQRNNGILDKIISMPVDEALGSDFTINSDIDSEQINDIEQISSHLDLTQKVKDCLIQSRLHGLSCIALKTYNDDDIIDLSDLSQLTLEDLERSKLVVIPVNDLVMLQKVEDGFNVIANYSTSGAIGNYAYFDYNYFQKLTLEGKEVYIGKKEYGLNNQGIYNQDMIFHPSRVFFNLHTRQCNINYSIPIYDNLYNKVIKTVTTYEDAMISNANCIQKPYVSVLKISDYALKKKTSNGQLTQALQNLNSTIATDSVVISDKDDFQATTFNASGLPSLIEKIELNLCLVSGIPYNKLFGSSATGFGSGDDAISNYRSSLLSIHHKAKNLTQAILQEIYNVVFNQDISVCVTFEGIYEISKEANSNEKDKVLSRVQGLYEVGLLSKKQAIEELNATQLLQVPIQYNPLDDEGLDSPPEDPNDTLDNIE